MTRKNIKIISVFLIICLVYGGIIIFVNLKNKDNSKILLLGDNDIFEYTNNGFIRKNEINKDYKYNVYVNGNYLGNYKIEKNDGYTFYDKNKKVDYNGYLTAYTDNYKMQIKPLIKDKVSNIEVNRINEIININSSDLTINEQIIVDLDNNGVNDKIINVSNLDSDKWQEKYFNLLYIVLNNNDVNILIKDIVEPKNALVNPRYYIYSILNFDNSNYDNIVIQKRYFSISGETQCLIFDYQNNQYVNLID